MPHLIILQCSNTKVPNGGPLVVNDYFAPALQHVRNELIHNIGDINQEQLLPAYLRYGAYQHGNEGGRLYTHINWQRLEVGINNFGIKVVIVSALFGLIEYDTPIPNYNLTIQNARARWINDNILQNALIDYSLGTPQENIRSYLSTSYSQLVGQFAIHNHWEPYDRGATTAGFVNDFVNQIID